MFVFLFFDFVLLDLKLFSSVLGFPLRLQQSKLSIIFPFFGEQWPLFPGGFVFPAKFSSFGRCARQTQFHGKSCLFFFCSMFFSRRMLVDFVSCAAAQDFLSPASQLVSIRASRSRVFKPPAARPDSDRFTDLTEPRLLSRSV
jgi:hypothetical protein